MIDLITVVFRQELLFLQLQAKSIDLHIDSNYLNKIFVLVNDATDVAEQIDVTWWGKHSRKVQILHRDQVALHPYLLDGWSSQQLYKLLTATRSEEEWAMCLDAKTWFCKKLEWHKLFDSQGRVRFKKFKVFEPFKSAQECVEQFFKIPVPDIIGPGGVPFMFHVPDIFAMMKEIETVTQGNFYDFFVDKVKYPTGLTEFVLYSAFVTKQYGNLDTLYSDDQNYIVVNIADFEQSNFDEKLNLMTNEDTFTISIHRRAYKLLTDSQFKKWADIVCRAGLFLDPKIAEFQLNTLR